MIRAAHQSRQVTGETLKTGTSVRTPVLRAFGVAKSYGATRALIDVDFELFAGEIHALLGGNGAGKSSFVNVLLGASKPDSGGIAVFGSPIEKHSVKSSISQGIIPIYQHLCQFPDLTVRENLAAFSLGTARGISLRAALPPDEEMQGWLRRINLSVSLDTPCRDLATGERQLLEIARAVGQDARALILDEPTAALTQAEASVLLDVIVDLKDRGVAILFISHKLDEVAQVADRVTVLRDGICAIRGVAKTDVSTSDIVRAMVGTDVVPVSNVTKPGSDIVAEIRNLRIHPDTRPIEFNVGSGEIVGLVGIVGSGFDTIAEAIAGAKYPASGNVRIDGITVPTASRKAALRHGIGFVPTDRHTDGVFDILSATRNGSASILSRLSRWGILKQREEYASTSGILKDIGLHPPQLELEAAKFSGGNQQKLVIARNLLIPGLRLLVLSEPTRGVDVAARKSIHEAILGAAKDGAGVIMASSDLDEVLGLCHRVLLVRDYDVLRHVDTEDDRDWIIGQLAGEAA